MSRLVDAVRLAVGTLSVLPVRPPRQVDRTVGGLAMVVAPVASLPLALAAAATVAAGNALLAPPLLTAALTVAVLAGGSAALHLDGLADTADGLAVPGDRERRLQVMRSGDVGPVGATTLLLVLLVQVSALAAVIDQGGGADAALTAGLAVVVSRGVLPLACLRGIPAARNEGLGSAVAGSVPVPLGLAVLAVLAALVGLLGGVPGVVGVSLALLVCAIVLIRARRQFGGVTGDVLGAMVELSLAAYLVAQVVHVGGAAPG